MSVIIGLRQDNIFVGSFEKLEELFQYSDNLIT